MRSADRRYFSPEIETMARSEIDRLRDERLLGDLLPWAYQRSALIRETWDAAGITADDVQSMDDFREKVPFIDKDAIRAFATGITTRTADCCASTRR
jgi:phenylacetate-CoA ligase